ncbi:MAG: sigma-70 family RNA polymerase sigma factor [Agathobacter sp.]|nr:sigma-70 family RNA polymerase sigma factor [Agathobacter sp.]
MEDEKIVQLYWDRNESAITETSNKYGSYCTSIARNILGDFEDAQECVNDTYLNAWNSMPPHRPNLLRTFLGKITRNLSFNKYKHSHADKRGGGETPAVLDELSECVSGKENVEQEIEYQELVKIIDEFLDSLSLEKRKMFVCRYWYNDSISEIAKQFRMKENAVSMTLRRIRSKLRQYLVARGYDV